MYGQTCKMQRSKAGMKHKKNDYPTEETGWKCKTRRLPYSKNGKKKKNKKATVTKKYGEK